MIVPLVSLGQEGLWMVDGWSYVLMYGIVGMMMFGMLYLVLILIIITQGMSFFGVELNSQINRLYLDIKLILSKNKYLPNFRTIYRSFAKYDTEQTGWVSYAHFEKALNQNGIFLKKFELQVFEKAFTHQGTINWFAFISHLRENLTETRAKIVDSVWRHLDSKLQNKIHYLILNERFNPCEFREFKLGHKSKDAILKEYLTLVPLTPDGYINYDQFVNFYTDLSVNIPSDETFCSFVASQWGYQYTSQKGTRIEQVKAALKTIRLKLLQRTNNTHQEFILLKLFNEFDVSKRGKLNQEDLNAMLVKIQIPTETRLLQPIIDKLSHHKDGYIDFQDFSQFLFYDPFQI